MPDTFRSRGFTLALALFVGLLGAYAVLQSPLFSLQTVELAGARRLTSDDVLLETGIRPGTHLFSIDLRRAARLLEQHPLIEGVSLRRRIPSTLVVRVEERTPVAYLALEGSLWMIDAGAIPVLQAPAPVEPLPLITLGIPVRVEPGVPIDLPPLLSALEFTGALPPDALALLSEVHVSGDGLTAFTRDAIVIDLGAGEAAEEKATVFGGLLDQLRDRNVPVSRIDLRHPKSPVIRQKR